MIRKKVIFLLYFIVLLVLFLYSFTQIDLNLTLSKVSFWFALQDFFQHIGYFKRSLSTLFYFLIVLSLFAFYIIFLKQVWNRKLKEKDLFILIILTAGILFLSYPAFSYDVFNYMFDAKIVTNYGQNPYIHKALDYPADPWINFMRWTHRTYPYGPSWLVFTVPLSYIGFQYFLPTLYLFKILMAASYLGSAYFLYKTLKLISKENAIFGTIFFALNPLVVIESLVSAHNDIVMIFFAILAIYCLVLRKKIKSAIYFLISGGVKFATLLTLPVFLLKMFSEKIKLKFSWEKFFLISFFLMIASIIAASIRTQFQPWYLLYIFPFASFFAKKDIIIISFMLISFAALLLYIPFLYFGNWDPPVPMILQSVMISSIILSLIAGFLWRIYSAKSTK